MLSNANLWHHKDFWAEVVFTACYLVNWSPHSSIEFKILEVWSGNTVDCSILIAIGCTAFAHINNGKLASRVVKRMFLGYAYESKGYRLGCPDSERVIQRHDVTFNESVIFYPGKEYDISTVDQ